MGVPRHPFTVPRGRVLRSGPPKRRLRVLAPAPRGGCSALVLLMWVFFFFFLLLTLRNIGLPERKNTAFGLNSYWEPSRFSNVITVKTETTEGHRAVSLPGPQGGSP